MNLLSDNQMLRDHLEREKYRRKVSILARFSRHDFLGTIFLVRFSWHDFLGRCEM